MRLLRMHPEVLFVDTTHGTNGEKKSYLLLRLKMALIQRLMHVVLLYQMHKHGYFSYFFKNVYHISLGEQFSIAFVYQLQMVQLLNMCHSSLTQDVIIRFPMHYMDYAISTLLFRDTRNMFSLVSQILLRTHMK